MSGSSPLRPETNIPDPTPPPFRRIVGALVGITLLGVIAYFSWTSFSNRGEQATDDPVDKKRANTSVKSSGKEKQFAKPIESLKQFCDLIPDNVSYFARYAPAWLEARNRWRTARNDSTWNEFEEIRVGFPISTQTHLFHHQLYVPANPLRDHLQMSPKLAEAFCYGQILEGGVTFEFGVARTQKRGYWSNQKHAFELRHPGLVKQNHNGTSYWQINGGSVFASDPFNLLLLRQLDPDPLPAASQSWSHDEFETLSVNEKETYPATRECRLLTESLLDLWRSNRFQMFLGDLPKELDAQSLLYFSGGWIRQQGIETNSLTYIDSLIENVNFVLFFGEFSGEKIQALVHFKDERTARDSVANIEKLRRLVVKSIRNRDIEISNFERSKFLRIVREIEISQDDDSVTIDFGWSYHWLAFFDLETTLDLLRQMQGTFELPTEVNPRIAR